MLDKNYKLKRPGEWYRPGTMPVLFGLSTNLLPFRMVNVLLCFHWSVIAIVHHTLHRLKKLGKTILVKFSTTTFSKNSKNTHTEITSKNVKKGQNRAMRISHSQIQFFIGQTFSTGDNCALM